MIWKDLKKKKNLYKFNVWHLSLNRKQDEKMEQVGRLKNATETRNALQLLAQKETKNALTFLVFIIIPFIVTGKV